MLWTRSIRNALGRHEGQAMVMGALFLLILAIAVLTTVNLGHTIHERVRLQNTSDAAAYSMAALEARAFNLYAFVNRTHASHYVAAMIWQSTLSVTYALEAFLTDVYGVYKSTLGRCTNPQPPHWTIICEALERVPYIGPVFTFLQELGNVIRNVVKFFQQLLRTADPDRWVGQYVIPAYRIMNQVLTGLSQATLYGTMTHVTSTSEDVVVKNDPNVESRASRLLSGALSACILERTHFKESGVSFTTPTDFFRPLNPSDNLDRSKVARAKRAMGNVSNATRFGADRGDLSVAFGIPGWVTNRVPEEMLPLPPQVDGLRGLLGRLIPDFKLGQTKMLSHTFAYRNQRGNDRNYIRDWRDAPNAPMSYLAQGDNIGSDDVYKIALGPSDLGPFQNPFSCSKDDDPNECWGDPRKEELDRETRPDPAFYHMVKPSIWALNDDEGFRRGGLHFRVAYRANGRLYPNGATNGDMPRGGFGNTEAEIGISKVDRDLIKAGPVTIFSVTVYVANVRGIQDGNHPWDGLAPFPHFEPGQYGRACAEGFGSGGDPSLSTAANRDTEFNQPSTWAVLHKTPEELRNPKTDDTGATRNAPSLLNDTGELQFAFSPKKLTLENTRKEFLGFAKGLNVVSRGQAYYHRPGVWSEHPNFFNPYWKPRLASVWQGRYSLPLIGQLGNALPGPLKPLPQKIITH